MAAGTQMKPSGNRILYAGSPIINGATEGLLSVFTDVSGATPSGNGRMFPDVTSPISANETTYRVTTGTYGGSYFINRNNTRGEGFYINYAITGSQFDIDMLHSYIHWTTDQRLSIDLQNASGLFYEFAIKIGATPIIDLTSFSPGPFGCGLDLYANLPGSAGAYTPAAINTGWTFTIGVAYDVVNNPPGLNLTFDVTVRDHHTSDVISANIVGVSAPGGRDPISQNIDVYIDYWRCARVDVVITP